RAPRRRGTLRGAGEPPHRLPVLAMQDGLDALGLLVPLRAAQRADDDFVLVAVDALAGQRRAPAVGAAVAIAGERSQALAEKLVLEVGAGSGHGRRIRRVRDRSCPKNAASPLVKNAVYVRIRTNYCHRRRRGAGGSGEMES